MTRQIPGSLLRAVPPQYSCDLKNTPIGRHFSAPSKKISKCMRSACTFCKAHTVQTVLQGLVRLPCDSKGYEYDKMTRELYANTNIMRHARRHAGCGPTLTNPTPNARSTTKPTETRKIADNHLEDLLRRALTPYYCYCARFGTPRFLVFEKIASKRITSNQTLRHEMTSP